MDWPTRMLKPIIDTSIVRLASPLDEGDLLSMARLIHEESPLRTVTGQPLFFSEAKARSLVRAAIGSDGDRAASWVGIVGERGNLQASVCLTIIEPSPFSHEQLIDAIWNFVRPEHRSTALLAKTLMAFSERVSDRLGVPLMVKSFGEHAGRKAFYERASKCQPFGSVFLYSSVNDSTSAAGA